MRGLCGRETLRLPSFLMSESSPSKREAWLEPVPEAARSYVRELLNTHPLRLSLAKDRNTRLGDYRPPAADGRHRISVNAGLNRYAFVITLIHEYAHLAVQVELGSRVSPHGIEWKTRFSQLMQPLLRAEVFPEPLLSVLKKHMLNPSASSLTDRALVAELRKFDPIEQIDARPLLSELPEGSAFKLPNGMIFNKGRMRRSRIACVRQDNRKVYLVHPLVRVEAL